MKKGSQRHTCWCNHLLLCKWQMPKTMLNHLEDILRTTNALVYSKPQLTALKLVSL
jgi:hypothetical protein